NKIYLFHTGDQDTDIITTDDSTFSYEISYHNTSGDTVFSMVILDTLPDYLDPASVSKPFSPHHPEFTIIEPNILYFSFEDIVLPDSSMDKLGSYGFIQFNVNMKPNLAPGTQIDNHATIIFNNKDQLTTNTVSVTIEDTASTTVNEFGMKSFSISIYPNPAKDRLNINMSELSLNSKFVLYNVAGEVVDYQTITNRESSIDVSKYPQGIYFINVSSNGENLRKKLVIIR
ncbi:MAG: T9SS type A sorting domain-containing protein, partial [Bacteroidia bacterium]|nr:T9SS type A sorting domain-containing protein [Bacteroidia bacterium]